MPPSSAGKPGFRGFISRVVASPSAPVQDPDWQVLIRVADGDVDAFGALVERHQERLVRLCARLLHDVEEARDAAQEVFLKAFRSAGRYRPQGQVFTWLYRIAVNHCLNRLRRKSLVRFLSLSGHESGESLRFDPPDPAPDANRALEGRRRWEITRQAIERLPPNQRTALVLAKFEGLSYREIAAVMETTESAVESRLVRAMRSLEKAQESSK